ncbi:MULTISPECIES: hypothetical protein [unclassified Streptomyces]|uniref:hypothetical protein n=1 Tax=unclassified Streptomyces TaxID=2593676 RepID=UPI0006ADFBEA|nr:MULTISPECIES: hypothetical protein [unclassified Streptomyces]KOX27681.1 membrane protein [Streptomyces sp. NRRL F-6491]KOX36308.1 membrane protein [Streptomyces sp. NRRL F-6492]
MSSAEQTPLSGTERTPADGTEKAAGGTERTPRPTRLAAAAAVAGVEALGLFAGGVYMLVKALTGTPGDLTGAVTGAVTLVVLGLIPFVAARGLWLRRSWSRGPAVITQILALPVAWQMLQANSAMIPAGAVLGVLAVTGLVLLVNPATTEALGIRRPGQDAV